MRSNGRDGACALGGRVGDEDGHPLRATVTLTDAHGTQLDHGTSDRDGTFTLRGRPGPALLIVSAPGFRPSADMTTLAPGDARVTIVLEARERAVSQS